MSRHFVEQLAAGTMTLAGDVAHHLLHVLRVAPGAKVQLFDDRGRQADATVVACAKKTVVVEVEEPGEADVESPLAITLLFALSKGQKPEWIVQKGVELGVREFVIFPAQRSVARWAPDDVPRKLARLETVAKGAAAQCGRAFLPVVRYAADTTAATAMMTDAPACIVLQPQAPASLATLFGAEPPKQTAYRQARW